MNLKIKIDLEDESIKYFGHEKLFVLSGNSFKPKIILELPLRNVGRWTIVYVNNSYKFLIRAKDGAYSYALSFSPPLFITVKMRL